MDLADSQSSEGEESKHSSGASDAAIELMKLLITLSAGVLALSGTFILQFRAHPWWPFILLAVSWIALVIAIVSALTSISAIVKSRLHGDDLWSTGKRKRAAQTSKVGFIVGIACFGIFALTILFTRAS